MTLFRRGPAGKLGAVIGVLAMLGLALVAPIHHLHAIARDFGPAHSLDLAVQQTCHEAGAGHPTQPPADRPGKAPLRCPVCTIGKMATILLPPSPPIVAVPIVTGDAPVAIATLSPGSSRPERTARPRAPPVRA